MNIYEVKISLKSLTGYKIGAVDGEIGNLKEVYFDDQTWIVRYLVVQTGSWLHGRKTLISTQAVKAPDWDHQILPTNLTIEQIKTGPDIDTDKPLYRQRELKLYSHFPWDIYWGLGLLQLEDSVENALAQKEQEKQTSNPHLRSSKEIIYYRVFADGQLIGTTEDFIMDTDEWKIQSVVVRCGDWLFSKEVLVQNDLISGIDWLEEAIHLNISASSLAKYEQYDPGQPINEVYERVVRDFQGRRI